MVNQNLTPTPGLILLIAFVLVLIGSAGSQNCGFPSTSIHLNPLAEDTPPGTFLESIRTVNVRPGVYPAPCRTRASASTTSGEDETPDIDFLLITTDGALNRTNITLHPSANLGVLIDDQKLTKCQVGLWLECSDGKQKYATFIVPLTDKNTREPEFVDLGGEQNVSVNLPWYNEVPVNYGGPLVVEDRDRDCENTEIEISVSIKVNGDPYEVTPEGGPLFYVKSKRESGSADDNHRHLVNIYFHKHVNLHELAEYGSMTVTLDVGNPSTTSTSTSTSKALLNVVFLTTKFDLHLPTFDQAFYSCSVYNLNHTGLADVRVSASDPDGLTDVEYELATPAGPYDFVDVDPLTGELRFTRELDKSDIDNCNHQVGVYEIKAVQTDRAERYSIATLLIYFEFDEEPSTTTSAGVTPECPVTSTSTETPTEASSTTEPEATTEEATTEAEDPTTPTIPDPPPTEEPPTQSPSPTTGRPPSTKPPTSTSTTTESSTTLEPEPSTSTEWPSTTDTPTSTPSSTSTLEPEFPTEGPEEPPTEPTTTTAETTTTEMEPSTSTEGPTTTEDPEFPTTTEAVEPTTEPECTTTTEMTTTDDPTTSESPSTPTEEPTPTVPPPTTETPECVNLPHEEFCNRYMSCEPVQDPGWHPDPIRRYLLGERAPPAGGTHEYQPTPMCCSHDTLELIYCHANDTCIHPWDVDEFCPPCEVPPKGFDVSCLSSYTPPLPTTTEEEEEEPVTSTITPTPTEATTTTLLPITSTVPPEGSTTPEEEQYDCRSDGGHVKENQPHPKYCNRYLSCRLNEEGDWITESICCAVGHSGEPPLVFCEKMDKCIDVREVEEYHCPCDMKEFDLINCPQPPPLNQTTPRTSRTSRTAAFLEPVL